MSEPALAAWTDDAVPPVPRAVLAAGERVYWCAQPIRHANGIGVWLIFALGVVFTVASAGALAETADRLSEAGGAAHLGLLALILALALTLFALLLLTWPLLSYRRMRRTYALITDRRVLEVTERGRDRAPRTREWPLSACTDPSVARRRGASATLVLQERLRERRSDGQTVYEWEALHGLPHADAALQALLTLKRGRR